MKKSLLLLTVIVSLGVLAQGCGRKARLAESAQPVVTQILKEQFGSSSAECAKVEIGDEITDNLYNATAILSNGNKLPITIYDKGKDILVTIKN